jgi:cob(I)alamin adenosyltransferase
MELTLDAEDVALLSRILSNYLSDLRMEIAQTDQYEWRQALKQDEERIKALLARLEQLRRQAPPVEEAVPSQPPAGPARA